MNGNWAVHNVNAVVAGAVLEDATVVVEDGLIVHVGAGRAWPTHAVDGRGAYLLPALIDVHSDGLEREIRPRPTATFGFEFALDTFSERASSAGISTVFHGVGFQERADKDRTVDRAVETHGQLVRHAGEDPAVDHRILYRVEARGDAVFTVIELLRELSSGPMYGPAGPPMRAPLVSFEDHTPGQGQYRDVDMFRRAVTPESLPDGETVEQYVRRRMDEGAALSDARDRCLALLGDEARADRIVLLAHDCESPAEVRVAADQGATVAEFPLTVEAASEARLRGMHVVMGAPNVLLGGSHSGNAAAAELVSLGLCTALASDYQPAALLAAAFALAQQRITTLAAAVGLVSSGPASIAGLRDRGTVCVGERGDCVLVALHKGRPRRVAQWSFQQGLVAQHSYATSNTLSKELSCLR